MAFGSVKALEGRGGSCESLFMVTIGPGIVSTMTQQLTLPGKERAVTLGDSLFMLQWYFMCLLHVSGSLIDHWGDAEMEPARLSHYGYIGGWFLYGCVIEFLWSAKHNSRAIESHSSWSWFVCLALACSPERSLCFRCIQNLCGCPRPDPLLNFSWSVVRNRWNGAYKTDNVNHGNSFEASIYVRMNGILNCSKGTLCHGASHKPHSYVYSSCLFSCIMAIDRAYLTHLHAIVRIMSVINYRPGYKDHVDDDDDDDLTTIFW